tara:strand:- start:29 stop:190 length:162 start_codon:yes stop_codon:yes gene_type:complete
MEAIPLISILVLLFSVILMSEIFKLKKQVRKYSRLTSILQKDINEIRSIIDDK